MTDPTEPTRDAFEHPDEAGDADGMGTLSQDHCVPIDEPLDDPHVPAFAFEAVKDEKVGIYDAIVGDREVAGLVYDVAGGDRLVLRATSVFPDFRKQGIATELTRRVLDDVRAQGKTVTIMCPFVRTFIENNPEYADLIDPEPPNDQGSPRTESVTMTINFGRWGTRREAGDGQLVLAAEQQVHKGQKLFHE
jgi:predicted GNAT family acetyltransferase